MIVDTGPPLPGVLDRWRSELVGLRVERIFITHFHSDHTGVASALANAIDVPIVRGAADLQESTEAMGVDCVAKESSFLRAHGFPAEQASEASRRRWAASIGDATKAPELVCEGDTVGDWEVHCLAGHTNGHLALRQDDVLIAGDAMMMNITPNISVLSHSRPDALARYLRTLVRIAELDPRIALPGHYDVVLDPANRAREIADHHQRQLLAVIRALSGGSKSAYDVSLVLFPSDLPLRMRRLAVGETVAHLNYLLTGGRVVERRVGGVALYSLA